MERDDLQTRFAFHPADTQDKKDAHGEVREICLNAADELNKLVPDGREKSLAITHLEQTMMWANAGIARSA